MTTVQSPPAPPTAIRPRVVARTGLYAVLAANAAVVAYFFAQAGFASNALIVIGRLFGLYGALVMAFQLVLVARLPWLDRLNSRTLQAAFKSSIRLELLQP